jgi:hypothetical protein
MCSSFIRNDALFYQKINASHVSSRWGILQTNSEARFKNEALSEFRKMYSYSHGYQVIVPDQQLWDASLMVCFPPANNYWCEYMRCNKHSKDNHLQENRGIHVYQIYLQFILSRLCKAAWHHSSTKYELRRHSLSWGGHCGAGGLDSIHRTWEEEPYSQSQWKNWSSNHLKNNQTQTKIKSLSDGKLPNQEENTIYDKKWITLWSREWLRWPSRRRSRELATRRSREATIVVGQPPFGKPLLLQGRPRY